MGTQERKLPGRPQLSDDVATYVRDLIVSGQVRAGDYLRLENLADQLGTSVTPVREALVSLRGEGFVVLQPRRGFVVSPFTKQDVLDIYQVQGYLAGELAARACNNLGEDAIAALVAIQEDLEAAHRRDDAQQVERFNHHFHRAINQAAASPKLTQFLVTATRYSPRLFFAQIAGWTQASADDHRGIIEAFTNSSPEQARSAMTTHVTNAGDLLTSHLEAEGMWDDA